MSKTKTQLLVEQIDADRAKVALHIKSMFVSKLHKQWAAGKIIGVDVFVVQRGTGRRAVYAPYVDDWTSVGYKIVTKILAGEIVSGVMNP